MPQVQMIRHWLTALSEAEDAASAGRAALAGTCELFGADEAIIRLNAEHWNDLCFRTSAMNPGLDAAVVAVFGKNRVVRTAADGQVLWAMGFDEVALGVSMPVGAPPPAWENARFILQPLIDRLEQIEFSQGMMEIDRAINRELKLDRLLDGLLDEVVDRLGFQFAAISLVNERKREIRMVRTRNVAPGWRGRSRYSLDDKDILADIARSRKIEKLRGPDDRFNQEIYEKYGHGNLVRLYAPMLGSKDKVIGVLEAGCPISEEAATITDENIRAVESMARSEASAEIQELADGDTFLDWGVKSLRRVLGAKAAAAGVWIDATQVLESADCSEAGWDLGSWLGACRVTAPNGAQEWRKLNSAWIAGNLPAAARVGVTKVLLFPLRLSSSQKGLMAAFLSEEPVPRKLFHARSYAQRMEPAITGHLLRASLRESLERSQNLTSLQQLVHASATSGKLEQALEVIGHMALSLLEADSVCIYQYFGERSYGAIKIQTGELHAESLADWAYPRLIVDKLLKEQDHFYAPRADEVEALAGRYSENRARFVEREEIRSTALILLKAGRSPEPVGLMFLNYKNLQDFPAPARKEIEALAQSAALAISSARYSEQQSAELSRRHAELEVLRKLDQEVLRQIQELDMDSIYRLILQSLMDLVSASYGCIMLLKGDRRTLYFQATVEYDPPPNATQDISQGIIGEAIRDRQSKLISSIEEHRAVYKEWLPGMNSEMVVPIIDRNEVVGAVNLEHREPGKFSSQDLRITELVASRLVFALHSADLYRQLKNQIQPRRALGVIATRIQDTQYDLDAILRLLLTGITAGEGLGFSRAILFLVEKDLSLLKGRLAVGAVDAKEAKKNWDSLGNQVQGDFDARLRALLEAVDGYSAAIKAGRERDSLLSECIQRIVWPLDSLSGALGQAVQHPGQGVIQVSGDVNDWFRPRISSLTGEPIGRYAFLAIPLVVRSVTIGVLVVDNRFIDGKEQYLSPQEELRTLEAFAELAAMSIENAELRERLQTEAHEQLAHQIKTPITLARGRLQYIEEALPGNEDVRIIAAQLERAQWVATSVRLFASLSLGRDVRGNFRSITCDTLENWITDVVIEFKAIAPRIEFYSLLSDIDRTCAIQGDQLLIVQVVFCLLDNALKYSPNESTVRAEWKIVSGQFQFCVANSCPHVPEDERKACKNRGSRGKVARSISTGSGLGLWIADHIVAGHKGTLEIESPGDEFRIAVSLPLVKGGKSS